MALTAGMVTNIKQYFLSQYGKKFPSLPRKHNKINWGNLYKGLCKLSSQEFSRKFNTRLGIDTRDLQNTFYFIKTSLSSLTKSHLESTHEVLSEVLRIFVNILFKLLILENLRLINLLHQKVKVGDEHKAVAMSKVNSKDV